MRARPLRELIPQRALLLLSRASMVAAMITCPVRADAASPAVARVDRVLTGVSIPNARRVEFVSKVNGHRYSISIALPFSPRPAKGYGVLYVLDGDFYFASAAEAARAFGNAPNLMVVGIGYPDDPAYVHSVLARRGPVPTFLASLPPLQIARFLERTYDLTLPASDEQLAAQTLPGISSTTSRNVGGLDDFLKMIEAEVKPRVAAFALVDATNQALFGHSLGGLAALHALFVEPNAFRTFIIASPSIWWNNKEVLADERRFAVAVNSGQAQPRVLVTVGGEESTPVKFPASWGIDDASAEASLRKSRMVENAVELVADLKALYGGPSYKVEDCVVFDKESHAGSPWSALARGIPFAAGDAK